MVLVVNVESKTVSPIATNVLRLGEGGDFHHKC